MRIRALQHVSIRSRDLARARDFYERLLGLPTVPRPRPGPAPGGRGSPPRGRPPPAACPPVFAHPSEPTWLFTVPRVAAGRPVLVPLSVECVPMAAVVSPSV